MHWDKQEIFKITPHEKQVTMFSVILNKEIQPVCKKFLQDPMEICVDDDTTLNLHGLMLYYTKLTEAVKNLNLNALLDTLKLN